MDYILDRFEQNVRETPDAPFLYDDIYRGGITYAQFDDMSARVYGWLKARGIGREQFVLICLPRGIMPLVVAVGVWKAGAAFVIVEKDYSPERIAFIRKDCGCVLELCGKLLPEILSFPPLKGHETPDPHDAAFAVYTSGTTGNPKGVLHEYGNIDRCLRSMEGTPLLRSDGFRPYLSPQNFIAGVIGLVAILAAPRTRLYIVPYAVAKNPEALIRLFGKHRFNVMFLSPSYARILVPKIGKYLHTLVLGSEPAGSLFFPDLDTYNFYGSSESFFLIGIFRIDRAWDIAPVGHPAFPLDLRLVDEAGQDVPAGETGEIVFDSPFFRGYINNPEENAKAFAGGYFHTGDLARRLESDDLVILGRAGDMVKINGNRVEPGEIENVFKRLTGADWAAARAFTEEDGKSFVCVYYTADLAFEAYTLRKQMSDYLPYYMIPSHFIRIERIPLRPNGKLDRKALPAPAVEDDRRDYAEPADETEKALCRAFGKVLGLSRVGAKDDFYGLGGDSLHSIQLVMESGLPGLDASMVFRGRTPEGIAALYCADAGKNDTDTVPEELNKIAMGRPHPLTAEQLYMVDMQLYTPSSTMYNLAVMLTAEKPLADAERLAEAAGTVIRAHPSLLTALSLNRDGEITQKWTPELFEPIIVERVSEAELSRISEMLIQPYSTIIGLRLYRCRVFETESRVCLFLDIHHIMADGSSFRVLLNDLASVYFGGEPSPDCYFALLALREQERHSSFFRESKQYFESLYDGVHWSVAPKADHESRENRLGEVSLPLGIDPEDIAAAEKTWHVSRNEFFICASLLTLALYNQVSDIQLSWIYNGRDDSRFVTTTGLLFRELPVGISLDQVRTPDELFSLVHDRVCGGIEHSCYPYTDEGFALSGGKGIVATVLYQRSVYDPVQFGEGILHPVEMSRNEDASQTLLDIQVIENETGILLELDYMATVYEETGIVRFGKLLRKTVAALCGLAGRDSQGTLPELVEKIQSERDGTDHDESPD